MRYANEYFDTMRRTLDRIWDTQCQNMKLAVETLARVVASEGVIHVFGAGHTQILVQELWFRAGQLACISPLFDEGLLPHNGPQKGSALEKLEGYGRIVFDHHDTRPGEAIIIISNSGRNPSPVEVALAAREKGLTVIGLTSLDYSTRVASKHSSGKRLFEVADIIIDNGGPEGDASIVVEGVPVKVGPITTPANAVILNAIFAQVVEDLRSTGLEPPVFISANLDVPLTRNSELVERYRDRVKYYKG